MFIETSEEHSETKTEPNRCLKYITGITSFGFLKKFKNPIKL